MSDAIRKLANPYGIQKTSTDPVVNASLEIQRLAAQARSEANKIALANFQSASKEVSAELAAGTKRAVAKVLIAGTSWALNTLEKAQAAAVNGAPAATAPAASAAAQTVAVAPVTPKIVETPAQIRERERAESAARVAAFKADCDKAVKVGYYPKTDVEANTAEVLVSGAVKANRKTKG
jgi:hypothetical protein